MAKFKVGDKVKCLLSSSYYTEGEVYEIGYCATGDGDFGVKDKVGDITSFGRMRSTNHYRECLFSSHNFELVGTKNQYEDFRNLSVGTKIVLKEGLRDGDSVGFFLVTKGIESLGVTPVTIRQVHNTGGNNLNYEVEGGIQWITPEMIDRVITEVITEEIVEEVVEEAPKVTEEDILHNHYFIDVGEFLDPETGRCIIDVYVILEKFKDISPAMQHVVKKALVTGGRGSKDYIRDLQDIIDTAEREKVIHSKR